MRPSSLVIVGSSKTPDKKRRVRERERFSLNGSDDDDSGSSNGSGSGPRETAAKAAIVVAAKAAIVVAVTVAVAVAVRDGGVRDSELTVTRVGEEGEKGSVGQRHQQEGWIKSFLDDGQPGKGPIYIYIYNRNVGTSYR